MEPAWRDFHAALIAGLPHAADIASGLDEHRLSYPTEPLFNDAQADVRCYGVIHRAWREGLLHEFLEMLCLWRAAGTGLCGPARRPEAQAALLDFVVEHRMEGLATMAARLRRSNVLGSSCESDSDLRHRLDRV